jgi:hypothetical protein
MAVWTLSRDMIHYQERRQKERRCFGLGLGFVVFVDKFGCSKQIQI